MTLKANISNYHEATGIKKGWLWVLLSVGIGVGVLVLYLRYVQKNRRLLAAYNEVDSLKIKANQQEHDAAQAIDKEKIAELDRQKEDIAKRIAEKELEISIQEKVIAKQLKEIKALSTWRDLDAYNKASRS